VVGISATEDELDVLNRLTPFLLFAGRYPVDLYFQRMRPRHVVGKGKTVPWYFDTNDFAIALRLRNRLMTQLRFGGPTMSPGLVG
jgi:hypothetical protein